MKFYVLKPDGGLRFGTKWAYGESVDPVKVGEAERCPSCQGPVSRLEWLPPHRIKLSSAKAEKWGDFLWGAGFDLMVSNRFRQAYEAEQLRGLEKFYPPAEIVRVGRRKSGDFPTGLPTYYLVKIPWGAANVDDEASGAVRKDYGCSYCRGPIKLLERIVIKPDSWNGSDIFIPRGLFGTILVSGRFKEVVESYELRNVWLIPSQQYAYDEHRPGLWYVRE